MKTVVKSIALAGFVALAACGQTPAENAAENVEASADNAADAIDAMADNTTNAVAEEQLENQADAVRDAGEANAAAANAVAANAMNSTGQ